MKKHMLLTLGLVLSSPWVLAQDTSKPATPALPGAGAAPAAPEVTQPTTDDKGNTSTGIRSQNGGLGATANKDKKTGTLVGEFAAMDVNGDGVLSRDEAGKMQGGLSFDQLDKNHDGKLNSIELQAASNGQGQSNSDSSKPTDKLRGR